MGREWTTTRSYHPHTGTRLVELDTPDAQVRARRAGDLLEQVGSKWYRVERTCGPAQFVTDRRASYTIAEAKQALADAGVDEAVYFVRPVESFYPPGQSSGRKPGTFEYEHATSFTIVEQLDVCAADELERRRELGYEVVATYTPEGE